MKSQLLIVAIIVLAVSSQPAVLYPTLALSARVEAADTGCSVARGTLDASGINQPSVFGYTEELDVDCDVPSVSVQAEAWIYGMAQVTCVQGTLTQSGDTCYKWDATNAQTQPKGYGCGTWTGFTRHWLINGSSWFLVGGQDFSTSLRAGLCPREPDGCESWEVWDEIQQRCIPQNTPIIIPLTQSQAYKLTNKAGGVIFDHNGDGVAEQTAWTAADSKLAFLVIDRNGNGRIDNGTELFGNHTMAGKPSGFNALDALNREMGGEEVGIIDSTQPIFAHLLLWEDTNHNGVSEPQELQPATNLLSDIGLGLVPHRRRDEHGNLFMFRGFAHLRKMPGRNLAQSPAEDRARRIVIYDVVFTER